MKIKSLTIKNDDLQASFQEAVIATAIGYGQMYKLLHKQLWDKDKLKESGTGYTISTGESVGLIPQRVVTIDSEITVNGRIAKPILHWNIKSPSANPYNPIDLQDLGLNQLFMGQSYKDTYDGNLKDGIYHDDCLIQPKAEDIASNDRMGWFIDGNGNWAEKDEFGRTITTDVSISGTEYTVVTPSGSTTYPLLQVNGANPTVSYVNLTQQDLASQYIDIPNMSEHGSIVYESEDVTYVKPLGVASTTAVIFASTPKALTRVYTDGTCVQFIAPSLYQYSQEGDIYYDNISGGIKYLPLVYLDTGDLVQNRSDFIDQWDDMFELYVHEDSYWYSGLIKIAVVVVSIVIAYYTGIYFDYGTTAMALSVTGGAIGGIGAISGNKVFQIVGALVSLGANVYGVGAKAIGQQALDAGLMGANDAAMTASNATLQQVFKGYISNAGLGNLLQIGSTGYSIYTTATAQEFTASADKVIDDSGMQVMIDNNEEYSDKVMDLIKL